MGVWRQEKQPMTNYEMTNYEITNYEITNYEITNYEITNYGDRLFNQHFDKLSAPQSAITNQQS